jgi:hypothetical protein
MEDKHNLERVSGYLEATEDCVHKVQITDVITAYKDMAYAIHKDTSLTVV